MKFYFCLTLGLMILLAGCGQNPSGTPTSVAPIAAVTATGVTLRTAPTSTAQAPQAAPTQATDGATVTPPPLPGQPETPTAPSGLDLSPSVTPMAVLPTVHPTSAPTVVVVPSATRQPVTSDALRGKILFKSARNGGKYPSNFQYFVMDADGSNVTKVDTNAANGLFQQLKPLEGYSPDKSYLVLGEQQCGSTAHCDLYVGPPDTIKNRSQGQWTPGGPVWYRADNPVWSPDANWIAFVWNRDNDRTKNIFKGMPFQKNQDFKRLTDFGGHRDTKDPTYSPDGSKLVFATQDGSRWQIWIVDATAENPTDANAHNLSNSSYDDWQPLWIK